MVFWSKRQKGILLVLFLLLLFGIVCVGNGVNSNRMLLTINFCNSYEDIASGKYEDHELDIKDALRFNNCMVPYAIVENTFFISQDMNTENWNGYFSCNEGYEVYFHVDTMWEDKKQAIRSNHKFSILIVRGESYRTASLVVSGLPIVSLTETVEMEKPIHFVLLDTEESGCYEGFCTSHLRGQTSTVYPKQGYKVELCDENRKEVKASLLGLRMDDDWILNPMYTDSTKVREKLAYQVWSDIQENHKGEDISSNITYVEFVSEHRYWGVYALMEPVDEKQLHLNETDLFFRKTDLVVPEQTDFYVEDKREYIPGFRIKYPKLEEVVAEDWLPLQRYVDCFYFDIYENDVPIADWEALESLVDVENVIDYEIFLAVVSGEDNIFKNIDYVMRYEGGNYVMHMVPWDLDGTFGNKGVGAGDDSKPAEAESMIVCREFVALYRVDNAKMEEAVRETWNKYRKTFLSTAYLQENVSSYMHKLTESGAMARDCAKWGECNGVANTNVLTNYIEKHMESLDAVFEKEEWWRDNMILRREEQWSE